MRGVNKLSARKVVALATPGRHSDGGGLYLVVDRGGAKRWAFLFRWREGGRPGPGKLREMGLGSALAVGLAKAREDAAAARAQVAARIDPIAARRGHRLIPSFGAVADRLFEVRKLELRSDKSVQRWRRSLEVYAAPLRKLAVDAISTDDVLGVLKPIWNAKPETAQKARGHIEAVLDAARAEGLRGGDNPARWKGHLDHLLTRHSKRDRGHHGALDHGRLPAFMTDLRSREGVAALALEFTILTAARSGEVLGATWSEINLDDAVWTIPGSRMKAGVEHRVPLSSPALQVLSCLVALRTGDFVFPGQAVGRPMSGMAMTMTLRRMGRDDITVHGFRSTFRDWAGECTTYPRELAEGALAHAIGDQTERAYRRKDALERRRPLMEDWGRCCRGGASATST